MSRFFRLRHHHHPGNRRKAGRRPHSSGTDEPTVAVVTGCSVEGCREPHHARLFCQTHYIRQKRGLPLAAPRRNLKPRTVAMTPELDLIAAILRGLPKLGGACKDLPAHIFDGDSEADVAPALDICDACPVRATCREWVESAGSGITTGIAGGLVLDVPARKATA